MDEIKVSVICTVYNHEKYLRKCLDGFIMQKTNFAFEVLVHDDASTDHSADIIREYSNKYPHIIKSIIQTENQYSKGIRISGTIILPLVRGKYIASCEGDDYWCDENKLQLQYDAMEAHSECCLCVHKVQGISENGKKNSMIYPSCQIPTGVVEQNEFMNIIMNDMYFQLSSFFVRTEEYKKYEENLPDFANIAFTTGVGDIPRVLYWGSLGNVYFIDISMSHYRMMAKGSWSSRMKNNGSAYQIKHINTMIKMYDAFNEYSNYKYENQVNRVKNNLFFEKNMLLLTDKEKIKFILKNENRWRYKRLSSKEKIYLILKAYAPWILSFYRTWMKKN